MKYLISIIFLLVCFYSSSQTLPNTPGTSPRSNASVIPEDYNLSVRGNFFLPRFTDTTEATTYQKGSFDTCGRVIFTYAGGGVVYVRKCYPVKYWAAVGGGGAGSITGGAQGITANGTVLELGSATQNASVFTTDRYINTGGFEQYWKSRSSYVLVGADSSVAGGAGYIDLRGPYGGAINFKSDTTARTTNAIQWEKQGVLQMVIGNDIGPSTHHAFIDLYGSTTSVNLEAGGLAFAQFGTSAQYLALRANSRLNIGATGTIGGQTGNVIGSFSVSDSVLFTNLVRLTDTTGFDVALLNRSTGNMKKMYPNVLGGLISTNIYNSDGTVTGDRTVTIGANDLDFTGNNTELKLDELNSRVLISSSNSIQLIATGFVSMTNPLTSNDTTTRKVLVYNTSNNHIEKANWANFVPTLQQVFNTQSGTATMTAAATNTIDATTGNFAVTTTGAVSFRFSVTQSQTGLSSPDATSSLAMSNTVFNIASDDSLKIWNGTSYLKVGIKYTPDSLMFRRLSSTIDTTTYKPFVINPVTGQVVMGNSWAQVSAAGLGTKWDVTGNSVADGTNVLGTTNNKSFLIYTNNTRIAKFDSTGCLSIGVATPNPSILGTNDAKLLVQGTIAMLESGAIKGYWGVVSNNGRLIIRNGSSVDGVQLSTTTNGRSWIGVSGMGVLFGINNNAATAQIHPSAGTATANSAPLKFNTGVSNTVAEAGAFEFTTDDLFFTITTGPARKRFLFADPVGGLTSGRVPFATTNGRLTDDPDLLFDGNNLGIGISPTASLTLRAGTATAGTAPIVFTAGTNLTAAVAGTMEYDGSELFHTNSTTTRGTVEVMRGIVSSAGTLTLAYTSTDYVFNGTTTTWTLPAVAANYFHPFWIKNAGSGNITLNTAAAGNDIYNAAAVNTLTITPGTAVVLRLVGSIFYVE